jgi:hypothetical protein
MRARFSFFSPLWVVLLLSAYVQVIVSVEVSAETKITRAQNRAIRPRRLLIKSNITTASPRNEFIWNIARSSGRFPILFDKIEVFGCLNLERGPTIEIKDRRNKNVRFSVVGRGPKRDRLRLLRINKVSWPITLKLRYKEPLPASSSSLSLSHTLPLSIFNSANTSSRKRFTLVYNNLGPSCIEVVTPTPTPTVRGRDTEGILTIVTPSPTATLNIVQVTPSPTNTPVIEILEPVATPTFTPTVAPPPRNTPTPVPPTPTSTPTPADKLPPFVKISNYELRPSPLRVGQVSVVLNGKVEDDSQIVELRWRNDQNREDLIQLPIGERGVGDFTSREIDLTTPLTTFEVEAIDGEGRIAKDSVTVRNNPPSAQVYRGGHLEILDSPRDTNLITSLTTSNQSAPKELFVRARLRLNSTAASHEVRLIELGTNGEKLRTLTTLQDLGDLRSGDLTPNDDIFSGRFTVNRTSERSLFLQVEVFSTSFSGQTYFVYSEIFPLRIYSDVALSNLSAEMNSARLAKELFDRLMREGETFVAARDATLQFLQSRNDTDQVALNDSGLGISILHKSGILGVITLKSLGLKNSLEEGINQPNTQESPIFSDSIDPVIPAPTGPDAAAELPDPSFKTANHKAIVISPFAALLGQDDDAPIMVEELKKYACEVNYFKDEEVTLDLFKSLHSYGIIAISTHSDLFFRGMEGVIRENRVPLLFQNTLEPAPTLSERGLVVLLTRIRISRDAIHTRELKDKSLAIVNGEYYGILPSFIEDNHTLNFGKEKTLPNSMVYVSGCRSGGTASLANAFLKAGAASFIGYEGYLYNQWAKSRSRVFFECFQSESVGICVNQINSSRGESPQPPSREEEDDIGPILDEIRNNPRITAQVYGSTSLKWERNIVNPSFEDGTPFNGWEALGDRRLIHGWSNLITPLPRRSGSSQAFLATNLFLESQVGSLISQKMCRPRENNRLKFSYNFISGEFLEFCTRNVQDTFVVSAEVEGFNKEELFSVSVEDLCRDAFLEVTPLTFLSSAADRNGSIYESGWQEGSIDVTRFTPNKPVKFSFEVKDIGDGRIDTVVLLDNFRFDFEE